MPGITSTASGALAEARPRPPLPLFGIVGGMGPLASAELLRTVYRPDGQHPEQEFPRVLLWSDPAVADRTEAIRSGDLTPLSHAVMRAVHGLIDAGAERVVVACVTAHLVLPGLPPDLLSSCVSLIDIIHKELIRLASPHLLLCTSGTARVGLLATGPLASQAARYLVPLNPADQEALHGEIYRLKRGADPRRAADFVRDALDRYQIDRCVAACTELHLVTQAQALPCIDPLAVVAQQIKDGEL